jgi:hypothetical protein
MVIHNLGTHDAPSIGGRWFNVRRVNEHGHPIEQTSIGSSVSPAAAADMDDYEATTFLPVDVVMRTV